jgi:hypothetical protein
VSFESSSTNFAMSAMLNMLRFFSNHFEIVMLNLIQHPERQTQTLCF